MADKVNFRLPDMTANLVFNVSGEDKLASVRRSLENLASGNKLQKYFADQEQMVQRVIDAFNQYNKIKSVDNAEYFVRSFNALKAVTTGLDLSTVIDGFGQLDALYQKIKSDQPTIDIGYRTSDFTDFLRMLEEVNKEGTDASIIINKLGQDTNIKNLNDQVAQLKSELGSAVKKLGEAQTELENLKNGSEIDRLLGVEENYTHLLSDMANEFENFLRANDLDADRNYGRWSDYFDAISHGAMTAHEAITEVKDDMIARGQPLNIDTSTFIGKLDETLAKVQEVLSTVDWLRKDIGDLSAAATSGGGISKMAADMEAGAEGAQHSREEIHQFLEETKGVSNAAELIRQLVQALGETDDAAQESVTGISKVLTLLDSLAHANIESVAALNGIFKNLEAVTRFDIDSKKMAALESSLTSLARIPDISNLSLLSTVDLSGFNNLSVSKASMVNLATYLPQISGANVDIEKLRALGQISLANFNKNNLSVSNAAFKHLQELIQTIQGVSNTPVSGPNLSGLDSAAQTIDRVTQKVKQEKEAYREGNEAKKEDVVASEAAAKAEAEKAKISELLAAALKREEEASRQNSAASEQDADRARRAAETYQELLRIQNEIGNRQVTLAGLNPERDAQQITALTNSIRTLQGQYDALFQQSGADLFEAQSNRLTRGFEQIALRVEEVRGRISDLSNSTAEADKLNVALTAVNNTLRSVESEQARMRKVTGGVDTDYYHSLTELAEQLRGLRDSGGSAAALTSGLKELKLAYAETLEQANLFKIGVSETEAAEASETRESSQHAAALEQLTKLYMQVEQARAKMAGVHSVMEVQEYEALAQRIREVQAADQAETMTAEQLKAVYAQLHQTFTEVNAASQPLIQQSKDRAAAEKEEAASIKQKNAEDKKANAEESKRASMVRTLNGIIRQCTDAEKKYAAVRNAPNLREYFDEFKHGAAKAQELKDKLESGEPITKRLTSDFNDLRVSVDNATTSMQTKGNVFQNYITSGMEQLASRMKYSLGFAAIVSKAVGEVKKMVSTAVELDSAMNTLQIVTRASGEEMDAYGKRVSSMAKETAQATKDLIDATTVYARLGYSMDESAILSKYTAMLEGVGIYIA